MNLAKAVLLVLTAVVLVSTGGCGGDDASTNPDIRTVPVLTTAAVTDITQTTARCGGDVTSDGGAAVTARGVCWSTDSTLTIADSKTTDSSGTGSYVSAVAGLTANTLYYVRAYATNSAGTGYGEERSFTTATQAASDSTGTVTDYDGNVYPTVKIGDQWWMAENLKVTHYRNGDTIPYDPDQTWAGLTTGAYCKYDNSDSIAAIFGLLYNWYAATDARNIAPEGWHVPSEAEWAALDAYLGPNSAGKLKDTSTAYWESPNEGATNETGFTGLPGGLRGWASSYANVGTRGRFLSATWNELAGSSVSYDLLSWDSLLSGPIGDWPWVGASIRCVKD